MTGPAPQWASVLASGALIAGVVAVTVHDWLTTPGEPPRIVVRTGALERRGEHHYLPFEVRNLGGRTAAAVSVTGELRRDGRVEERSTLRFDFLAPGESDTGHFMFSAEPAGAELVVRPTGFRTPP